MRSSDDDDDEEEDEDDDEGDEAYEARVPRSTARDLFEKARVRAQNFPM